MAQIREKRDFGPSGLADVRLLKQGARVSFPDGSVYDVASIPPTIKTSGKYVVTLTTDKSKILGVHPPAGQYILSFRRFGNRIVGKTSGADDGLPVNKIQRGGPRQGKNGVWMAPDQLVCVAEFVIEQHPQYEGLIATANVPYSFSAPQNGNLTEYVDKPKNLQRLETFLHCATNIPLNNIDIEYADDSTQLLLRYEKFIQSHHVLFMGRIGEKGFAELDSFAPMPEYLLTPAKAAPKAKKGTKK